MLKCNMNDKEENFMTKQEKIKKIIASAESKMRLAINSFDNQFYNDAHFYVNEVFVSLDPIVYINDKSSIEQIDYIKASELYKKAMALQKELKRVRVESSRENNIKSSK